MAEKFGAFRCSGTGIAPFLPVKPPRTERDAATATIEAMRDYVIGPLFLVPIRFLLLAVSLIIMGIGDLLDTVAGVMLWLRGSILLLVLISARPQALLPILGWYGRRLFYVIGARLALFALGFFYIPFQVLPMKKG